MKFFYKAINPNTKADVSGYVEAQSPREVRQHISSKGLLPVLIREAEVVQAGKVDIPLKNTSTYKPVIKKLSIDEQLGFVTEMQVMINSGISVLEALEVIVKNSPSQKVRLMCADLGQKVKNGMSFSEAVSIYKKAFGDVFTGLCISGEQSGKLALTMERMVDILKKIKSLKEKLIQASIYPAILTSIIVGMYFLFGLLVFPKFAQAFQLDNITGLAGFITDSCQFVVRHWIINLAVIVSVGCWIKFIWEESLLKGFFDNLVLKIPVVRDFARYSNLSSFFAILGVAYDAGVPMLYALELSQKSISNNNIKKESILARSLVEHGKSLSEAFSLSNLVPDTYNVMVATGEKSGTLGKMFAEASQSIDKKIESVMEALARLFEPTMMVVIGIFVAIMVVAFMQMYAQMLGSLI